ARWTNNSAYLSSAERYKITGSRRASLLKSAEIAANSVVLRKPGIFANNINNPLKAGIRGIGTLHKPRVKILILRFQQFPITFFIGLLQTGINIFEKRQKY